MDISINNILVLNILCYFHIICISYQRGKAKSGDFGQTELTPQLTQEGGILHFVRYPPR